jgi:DNA-binding CsgD family transcriptional regulator
MTLDEKDKEILSLMSSGDKLKEIAAKVYLSPRTVEKRIYRARVKNKCRTVQQLLAKYVTFVL